MRKLLILPLLLAAACDGGGGPSGSGELTAAEAAELSRAMFSMATDLASAGLPGGASFALVPRQAENSFTVPVQETVPCTPSGSTEIEGTVTVEFDDVALGISMEADVSVSPKGCAHRMENGDVIKISGDPDIDIHLIMAGDAEELTTFQVTETGAFRWTRGGASGRCTVDLSSLLNAPTQMVTVSGTFCGFPVSETFPLEG